MKKTLRHVEVIGLGVLMLVLLAISDTQITDYFFAWSLEYKAYIIMVPLVILSILFGFMHSIERLGKIAPLRSYFGALLLIAGGGVFFFLPEYFHTLIASEMGFWNKVSTYSLPAICVEGGLFTLFTEFLEHERRTTQREYLLLSLAFLLYAAGSVTANFLVLSGHMSTDHQILFARGIVLVTATVGLCVKFLHPKTQTPSD